MKNDLQNADSQNVYAATLTSKIFRVLIALMIAFHLKTRQLDVVNCYGAQWSRSILVKVLMTEDLMSIKSI
jgi:hypothetical protein